MFYFRINKIKIFDNKSNFLFWDRNANIKIYSFVTENIDNFNELGQLFSNNSRAEQEDFIKQEVRKIVNSREFIEVDSVRDNHIFTFGDSGYVVYQSENIPEYFNFLLLLLESDKEFEKISDAFLKALDSSAFSTLLSSFLTIMQATPITNFYTTLATFVTKTMLDVAKTNKDDVVGLMYMSLNRIEHYPHLIRNVQNVSDLTRNMELDYSLFGYETDKLTKKNRLI